MFTMVALPATSRRNATCTASALVRVSLLSCSTQSLLMRSSFGSLERASTSLPR